MAARRRSRHLAPGLPIRRTTASPDWHPEHGDRRIEIRVTGIDIATTEPSSALDEVVLTDTEMTA